jgi:hypothetical protein
LSAAEEPGFHTIFGGRDRYLAAAPGTTTAKGGPVVDQVQAAVHITAVKQYPHEGASGLSCAGYLHEVNVPSGRRKNVPTAIPVGFFISIGTPCPAVQEKKMERNSMKPKRRLNRQKAMGSEGRQKDMSTDYWSRSHGLPGAVNLDPTVYTQGINMLRTKDRRASARENMSETVLFRLAAPGMPRQFLTAQLKDISSGGVLFLTETRLAEGDLIDIFFKTQSAYADTCARAEVLRANNLGARYEIGAKFV